MAGAPMRHSRIKIVIILLKMTLLSLIVIQENRDSLINCP